MRTLMIGAALLAVGFATACRDDKTAGQAPAKQAQSGLNASVTPTGQADVYITDDKGTRIDATGATGRVEFSDGRSVPLTPSDGGHMTAPLGDHARNQGHGCEAIVRVTPRGGGERVARLDMCDESRVGGMHGEHGEGAAQ